MYLLKLKFKLVPLELLNIIIYTEDNKVYDTSSRSGRL